MCRSEEQTSASAASSTSTNFSSPIAQEPFSFCFKGSVGHTTLSDIIPNISLSSRFHCPYLPGDFIFLSLTVEVLNHFNFHDPRYNCDVCKSMLPPGLYAPEGKACTSPLCGIWYSPSLQTWTFSGRYSSWAFFCFPLPFCLTWILLSPVPEVSPLMTLTRTPSSTTWSWQITTLGSVFYIYIYKNTWNIYKTYIKFIYKTYICFILSPVTCISFFNNTKLLKKIHTNFLQLFHYLLSYFNQFCVHYNTTFWESFFSFHSNLFLLLYQLWMWIVS